MRTGKEKKARGGKGELARVGALRAQFGYRPDDEGFSLEEYAEQYKLSRGAAVAEVQRMMDAGELVKGCARRADSKGTRRRVNVFRMK